MMCRFLGYLALLLGIFQAVEFVSSVQTFSGIAQVVTEETYRSLTDDLVLHFGTSLQSVLFGDIDDVKVVQKWGAGNGQVTISFRAYFEDIEAVPACLQNDTYYYENGTTTVTYTFLSVMLQNFGSDFEAQCTDKSKYVSYFGYLEEDCQFRKSECESKLDLRGLYRYELVERGSVLYSFFCVDVDGNRGRGKSCYNSSDWLPLEWKSKTDSSCRTSDGVIRVSRRSFAMFAVDDHFDFPVRVDTLPFTLDCPTPTFGLPIILLYGDQTWDKLPEWLKVCLRVLNGVSVAALLFCILTFAMFKELRNTHGKNVLSLLVAGMLSLFYTSGYIPLATDNRELCAFLATLIYYFVLVPNYWWMAVAIFLAWTFGRKGIHRTDESSGSRFFLLLSFLGWGMPLIFALLVGFVHIGGVKVYDIDEYCWIIDGWPNYLIAVQTFCPFFVDCALFVLVVYRLRATRQELASLDKGGKSKWKNDRRIALKMAAIFGVFWLPSWVIYVAFLFNPITSLAVIAQLLNQLSTFILPIVLCCNRRVVTLWNAKLAPLRDRLISSFSRSTSSDSHNNRTPPVRGKPRSNENEPVHDEKDIQLHETNVKKSLEIERI